MKKFFLFLSAAVLAFSVVGCEPKDPEEPDDPKPTVEAPTADFDYSVDGLSVSFTNKSKNATSYKWSFGDEETSKDESPKHTYAAAGTYSRDVHGGVRRHRRHSH